MGTDFSDVYEKGRIAIKDIFDMIVGISATAVLTAGMALRSPMHSDIYKEPRFDIVEYIDF